jgi:hypothetical protein
MKTFIFGVCLIPRGYEKKKGGEGRRAAGLADDRRAWRAVGPSGAAGKAAGEASVGGEPDLAGLPGKRGHREFP